MNDIEIRQIVETLSKERICTFNTEEDVNKAIDVIKKYLSENDLDIVSTSQVEFIGGWSYIDVLHWAKEMKVTLDIEEAKDVIETVSENWDANDGINWNLIEYYINEYIEQDPEIKTREFIEQEEEEDNG